MFFWVTYSLNIHPRHTSRLIHESPTELSLIFTHLRSTILYRDRFFAWWQALIGCHRLMMRHDWIWHKGHKLGFPFFLVKIAVLQMKFLDDNCGNFQKLSFATIWAYASTFQVGGNQCPCGSPGCFGFGASDDRKPCEVQCKACRCQFVMIRVPPEILGWRSMNQEWCGLLLSHQTHLKWNVESRPVTMIVLGHYISNYIYIYIYVSHDFPLPSWIRWPFQSLSSITCRVVALGLPCVTAQQCPTRAKNIFWRDQNLPHVDFDSRFLF